MTKSLTYYLVLFVLKIKGIKNLFSQDPINYQLLRKDDIHIPKQNFFPKNSFTTFQLMDSRITEIKGNSKKLIIYIHGGAFIIGPSKHHWNTIKTLSKSTNYNIWLCDYPKAPENKITTINENIDFVYETAVKDKHIDEIVLIGDSAGATLILTLIQRKIKLNIYLPTKIILISPVLDASLENSEITKLDKSDPMLASKGLLSALRMCIEDGNLKNTSISPLFGTFEGFPITYLFIAENDVTFPDQLVLCHKLKELEVEHYVEIGKGMPHIWPLLPVMDESRKSLNRIIEILNK